MSRTYFGILVVFVLAFFAVFETGIGWDKLFSAVGMSSSTFSITSDSLNSGGRDDGASSSYGLEDTVGEVATGRSASVTYGIQAGYRQMNNSYLAITTSPDLALSNIGGISASEATGDVSWTVTTDNPAGYELAIQTQTKPALSSNVDFFEDYVPNEGVSDFNFSVPTTSSAFGFSPEGVDIVTAYKDDGNTCGVGSNDTAGACWDGFATSTKTVARSMQANQPTGTQTTIAVRAANGSEHVQSAGDYSAVITITALVR